MRVLTNVTEIADELNHGAVGIMPSDTVYGLMCRAADEQTVRRFYEIKNGIIN